MSLIRHYNEKSLLIQIANGDEKAFQELFYTYHNKLGAYVMGWTKSLSVAEEIVQDIFLKIWINREALSTVERFDKYLYILSRNHTFNALRQSGKERLKRHEWERHFEDGRPFDSDTYTEDYISLIEQAVAQLSPQQHKVYTLKHLQGFKYNQIANRLNISPETARKHHTAALRNITTYVRAHLDIAFFILVILCQ